MKAHRIRRYRQLRRLQVRLLFWFLGAILLAIAASIVVTVLTAEEVDTPTRIVSRQVQHQLAATWDDPKATDAYVAQLHATTGLDVKLRRDPTIFQNRRGRVQGGIIFEDGIAYVPIQRGPTTLGALEVRTASPAPRLWRIVIALGVAVIVLGGAARRVSVRLARPLEHLATTAERFGAGDLQARVGVEGLPARWVAEEVKDVGRAFDTMADRISRIVTEQRELLAAISHELRSPLGRARVALEIARERTEGDPQATRPLEDADKQLVEADAILGDLLASARAGLADLHLETVELGSWIRDRVAAETAGPIEVSSNGEATTVEIDPALFGRALHNVLANAWAHGHPKETPLAIRLDRDANEAVIAVQDKGPGFTAEILPRAFEPFVTGGSSARSPGQGGIGLGLSLVRRIVDAHRGRVAAKNLDSGGAEVELRLPLFVVKIPRNGAPVDGPIRSTS